MLIRNQIFSSASRVKLGVTGTLLVLGVICLLSARAHAMFALPSDAPVGRLVANISAHLRDHPNDAEGHYVLGRVHCFAFVCRTRRLEYHEGQGPFPFISDRQIWSTMFGKARHPIDQTPPTTAELGAHLTEGIRNLEKAVRLAPKNTQYRLGLAYLLEEGAGRASDSGVHPSAKETSDAKQSAEFERSITDLTAKDELKRNAAIEILIRNLDASAVNLFRHRNDADPKLQNHVRLLLSRYWREQALREYTTVFNESYRNTEKDAAAGEITTLDMPISWEAGVAIVRLIEGRSPQNDGERSLIERVRSHHKYLDAHIVNAVTPIIFRIDGDFPLAELLSPFRVTRFNLDGRGRNVEWPWVRPETAFLVWDPSGMGDIRSGRQLFGSATWWMFFRDGYHVMYALDDDRNGWLEGRELLGISAWLDRNSNGISDPGEVHTVSSLGIVGLDVRATTQVGRSPTNPRGLKMADGRLLPTYDWVTSPIERTTRTPEPLPLIRLN